MGAGRKTQTIHVDTRNEYSNGMPANRHITARHLRKEDLGGVIFGCTNDTLRECLEKQLFGLPASHFLYVQNIEAGLPLFLFNYTTRKLHGIYKAASRGRVCIDPYCWSVDGKEKTSFPAQVRICTQTECLPLAENQYKPLISDNYYALRHFWFELDHAQVEKLLTLFASRPVSATFNRASVVHTKLKPLQKLDLTFSDQQCGYTNSKMTSLADMDEAMESRAVNNFSDDVLNSTNWPPLKGENLSDIESKHSCASGSYMRDGIEEETKARELMLEEDENGSEKYSILQKLEDIVVCRDISRLSLKDTPDADIAPGTSEDKTAHETKARELMLEVDESGSEKGLILQKLKDIVACRDISRLYLKDTPDADIAPGTAEDKTSHEILVSEARKMSQIESASPISVCQDVEMLKSMYEELQKRLAKTESEVHQVKTRVFDLEIAADCQQKQHDESVHKACHELSEKLIYLVGGNDGTSCLSSLESYSPSTDILKSLKPMSAVRSNATAIALNGSLYVLGGGNGSSWYDSVECYRPERDEWTKCPSLMQKKGSLSGAAAQNKLYAMGGGNGINVFSDVEMFDPILGRWIPVQSMHERRLAAAAAELNGALYTVGGFNGKKYLQSLERFDPREPSWTRLQSMTHRRGCHSLVVLNEKLYALGGYDGTQMMSTVEIFDPCANSWMVGEPMSFCRGYSGSVVLQDCLFVIAGLVDFKENLVDKVECYKEGQGWEVTGLKAVGKKFSFATAVI